MWGHRAVSPGGLQIGCSILTDRSLNGNKKNKSSMLQGYLSFFSDFSDFLVVSECRVVLLCSTTHAPTHHTRSVSYDRSVAQPINMTVKIPALNTDITTVCSDICYINVGIA